jgi:hypothetical protein
MDEFLNELYGTSEIISGDDLEKQAAAEFLVKMAEEEGVNLDDLSDDEVAGLLSEIEGDMGKQASATDDDGAQEKLAEADFLGRAMAHAYVNELNEIEKEARRATGSVVSELGRRAKGALGKAKEWAGIGHMQRGLATRGKGKAEAAAAGKIRERLARGSKAGTMSEGMKGLYGQSAKKKSELGKKLTGKGTKELGEGISRFGKRVVLPGAAVGTGAALLSKKSSDAEFDAIAEERALELLAEAGYDVGAEHEKVAEAELSQALDTRALEILESNGYPVNWS